MTIKVRSCGLKQVFLCWQYLLEDQWYKQNIFQISTGFATTRAQQDKSLKSGVAGVWHQKTLAYIPKGITEVDLEFTWLLSLLAMGVPIGWDLRCSGALKISFPKWCLLFFGIEFLLKCGMLVDSLCQLSFVARQIAEATRLSASTQAVAVLPATVGATWIKAASTVTRE